MTGVNKIIFVAVFIVITFSVVFGDGLISKSNTKQESYTEDQVNFFREKLQSNDTKVRRLAQSMLADSQNFNLAKNATSSFNSNARDLGHQSKERTTDEGKGDRIGLNYKNNRVSNEMDDLTMLENNDIQYTKKDNFGDEKKYTKDKGKIDKDDQQGLGKSQKSNTSGNDNKKGFEKNDRKEETTKHNIYDTGKDTERDDKKDRSSTAITPIPVHSVVSISEKQQTDFSETTQNNNRTKTADAKLEYGRTLTRVLRTKGTPSSPPSSQINNNNIPSTTNKVSIVKKLSTLTSVNREQDEISTVPFLNDVTQNTRNTEESSNDVEIRGKIIISADTESMTTKMSSKQELSKSTVNMKVTKSTSIAVTSSLVLEDQQTTVTRTTTSTDTNQHNRDMGSNTGKHDQTVQIKENRVLEHVTIPCDFQRHGRYYDASSLVAATSGGAFVGGVLVLAVFYCKQRLNRFIRGDYRRLPMQYDFELNPRLK